MRIQMTGSLTESEKDILLAEERQLTYHWIRYGHKYCKNCDRILPISKFGLTRRNPVPSYRPICRICFAAAIQVRYTEDSKYREQIKERMRQYRLRQTEKEKKRKK